MIDIIATFVKQAIIQGIPLLYGSTGEIITEKSGNLNLGIPGIMYIGGIAGAMAIEFEADVEGDVTSGLSVWDELQKVYEPVFEMERRLRELEEEMSRAHEEPARFSRLSSDYDKLLHRF